jgi:hypothetical protein
MRPPAGGGKCARCTRLSEHYDADSLSRAISNVGSEKEGRMALDGIVRMVDAFFRQWDDPEKMWSEYERAGFRLVVIGGELRISELSPVERMKYRCKHRRLAERWRDMRLEGSKFDGVADASALDQGRKLGLFEDMVEDEDRIWALLFSWCNTSFSSQWYFFFSQPIESARWNTMMTLARLEPTNRV